MPRPLTTDPIFCFQSVGELRSIAQNQFDFSQVECIRVSGRLYEITGDHQVIERQNWFFRTLRRCFGDRQAHRREQEVVAALAAGNIWRVRTAHHDYDDYGSPHNSRSSSRTSSNASSLCDVSSILSRMGSCSSMVGAMAASSHDPEIRAARVRALPESSGSPTPAIAFESSNTLDTLASSDNASVQSESQSEVENETEVQDEVQAEDNVRPIAQRIWQISQTTAISTHREAQEAADVASCCAERAMNMSIIAESHAERAVASAERAGADITQGQVAQRACDVAVNAAQTAVSARDRACRSAAITSDAANLVDPSNNNPANLVASAYRVALAEAKIAITQCTRTEIAAQCAATAAGIAADAEAVVVEEGVSVDGETVDGETVAL